MYIKLFFLCNVNLVCFMFLMSIVLLIIGYICWSFVQWQTKYECSKSELELLFQISAEHTSSGSGEITDVAEWRRMEREHGGSADRTVPVRACLGPSKPQSQHVLFANFSPKFLFFFFCSNICLLKYAYKLQLIALSMLIWSNGTEV
jgi:hypothetical protein